VGTPKNDIVW
jgi:hypothetical protein